MLGVIIQARLGSSRLPNKMTKPFYQEKGVFELLTSKIRFAFPDLKIVVATTTNDRDNELVDICKKLNVKYHRGSENNVLLRFIETAEKYNINKIVRVCADNPFLNMLALKELIDYGDQLSYDYISFKSSEGKPTILTHYGFWAEMLTLQALQKVLNLTNNPLYLEHVTNFIYSHPMDFNLDFISISTKIETYDKVRMTLDTLDDFNLLQEIYTTIPDFNGKPEELIEIVAKRKDWIRNMEIQMIKNEK